MRRAKRVRNRRLAGTCQLPDRDVPELLCGYPRPCPHHTIVVVLRPNSETPQSGADRGASKSVTDGDWDQQRFQRTRSTDTNREGKR